MPDRVHFGLDTTLKMLTALRIAHAAFPRGNVYVRRREEFRQAVDAVRGRIDWKYVSGPELTDAGFDTSVLSEFRTHLLEGQAEHQLFEKLLLAFKAKGWVKARGRQRRLRPGRLRLIVGAANHARKSRSGFVFFEGHRIFSFFDPYLV
jgi:hypothetical protein